MFIHFRKKIKHYNLLFFSFSFFTEEIPHGVAEPEMLKEITINIISRCIESQMTYKIRFSSLFIFMSVSHYCSSEGGKINIANDIANYDSLEVPIQPDQHSYSKGGNNVADGPQLPKWPTQGSVVRTCQINLSSLYNSP